MKKRIILFQLFVLASLLFSGVARAQLYPVITTTPDRLSFKPGESILFDSSNSYVLYGGTIVEYDWYVNGSLVESGANATTYTTSFTLAVGQNSKTVTVELELQDDMGDDNFQDLTITILRSWPRVYYLTDNLGSVRVTVDQSGNPVGYDDYYPFGKRMPGRSNNTANPHDAYKFTGKELDQEDGIDLEYFGARYYDPEIGRFLSVDPMAENFPEVGPYTYAHNNPILRIDLFGMADTTYLAFSPPAVVTGKREKSNIFYHIYGAYYNFRSYSRKHPSTNIFPFITPLGLAEESGAELEGAAASNLSNEALSQSEKVDNAIQFIKDNIEQDKVEYRGGNKKIPTVSKDVAKKIIDKLMGAGAKVDPTKGYNGTWYDLPGGKGGFGIKTFQSALSDRLGTTHTINLDIPELKDIVDEIKY